MPAPLEQTPVTQQLQRKCREPGTYRQIPLIVGQAPCEAGALL